LSALFGYTQRLYLVQAVGYAVFLITIGGIYFQSLTGRVIFPTSQSRVFSTKKSPSQLH
jgi:high-affinity iron transporter